MTYPFDPEVRRRVTETYPFDPEVRRRVTELLYAHLPELYRIRDLPDGAKDPASTTAPRGTAELYKFLSVLAAPLAELRENVDELHADLFIDKCADWVLPYLAEMVGMNLVFPDAPSNRRDVRGTVAWRRRKGNPAMLQEMGSELSGQMVVTQEGWKRLLLFHDLDLPRLPRTLPSIVPAILAEQVDGPLDATHHVVDPRRIGLGTGRYHPKHVTHWTHPTQMFPLREGTAFDRTRPGDSDLRYGFHPLGVEGQLRVRRADPQDRVATDRVPLMHFAARPGDYFDQEGSSNARFTVRIAGLPGGVAAPIDDLRTASAVPVGEALARSSVVVTVLEHTSLRLTGAVDVEVFAVPLGGAGHDTPETALGQPRGGARIAPGGVTALAGNSDAVASPFVAMLRLRAAAPEVAAHFPGAVLELAGVAIDARLAASDVALATAGFLAGALVVHVPATWVWNDRWLFIAADGSVFDAQSKPAMEAGAAADLVLQIRSRARALPADALSVGPGPAWPPLPRTATLDRWRAVPCAPTRGPVIIHGGSALLRTGPGFSSVGAGVAMGIVFAARSRDAFHPFLRLDWTGGDPTAALGFTVLGGAGPLGTVGAIQQRLADIGRFADEAGDALELVARLEAEVASIVLPPCELVYTGSTGDAVLVHLPQLETKDPDNASWKPSREAVSDAVSVSADGSTYVMGTLEVARYAYGSIAPIRQAASHRRRRVRQRTLCPWNNETALRKLAPTPAGVLDVDPLHGLFALAASEPAPSFTRSIEGIAAPAPVTVDYQEAYSHHLGARPDAREPILDAQQPAPTRLVVGAGRLHRGAGSSAHELPRYATLSDALAAIALGAEVQAHEIVQIEDSATYAEPALLWPANITSLTIQAAEFERPVLVLSADWRAAPSPVYHSLTLRGLVLATSGHAVVLPAAAVIDVQLCTVAEASGLLRYAAPSGGAILRVVRSITGRIQVSGEALLSIVDSVVDAASGMAIDAPDATVQIERATVVADPDGLALGRGTLIRAIEASEVIFTDRVVALDRFRGCVRYSRVEPGSQLPRRHRVVEDEVAFVTRDRDDPAHLRLSERCARAVLRGAEDGSEMGAFHGARLAQQEEARSRRIVEFTPAGLLTGIIRLD